MCAYVAVAAAVDEQSRVTGITLGLTLVAFIATAGLRAADAPEALRWFTPFEHYHSAEAMSGDGLPLLPLVLLPSLAVAAATAAIYWYNRRDIAI
jgi:putative exporter of polyketide antibiotics